MIKKNKWIHFLSALPLLWGALALFPVAHAEEFLDPEVAFKFSARALDANTLEARWQIADGYYMYRDKFKFEVAGATLGAPQLPAGKVKEDISLKEIEKQLEAGMAKVRTLLEQAIPLIKD